MITNKNDPETTRHLDGLRREIPAAIPVLEALESHADPFQLREEIPGAEFVALRPVESRPNRAVVKLFVVADGPQSGRTAVFFYKRSQIPFSRDRHSYGAVLVPETGAETAEIASWLDFASSGFDPESRPAKLRQAITFSVPD